MNKLLVRWAESRRELLRDQPGADELSDQVHGAIIACIYFGDLETKAVLEAIWNEMRAMIVRHHNEGWARRGEEFGL